MSRELRTDGTLQPDSSSSSSSPHSTSSHDEEILEVTGAGFMPKPIYNFSIPDVIKHEPRMERNENRFENSDALIRRKRAHQNFRDNVAFDENSVSVRNKRRRRSITAAVAVENILEEANNDDDCHRPPVIDLTDIDSHDEYQSAHSDSEINDVPITETRPLHHASSANSFNEVLSDLQRFRQQFEDSQENRFGRCRASSIQRLQRLRRRRTPRTIITDGPLVSDDLLFRSPEAIDVSTPEATTADDSVLLVNEVRGNQTATADDDDHSIALRMAHDPTYSPPYHSPADGLSTAQYRTWRHGRGDESFVQFQETIRSFRQRSRERLEQARRITQEAHERLARIHDSINNLRHGGTPTYNTTDASNSANGSTEHEVEDRIERTGHEASNDDVEITHEWNPRSVDYIQSPVNLLSPLPPSFHSMQRRHFSSVPDLLRPFMNSFLTPVPPPRLHHLHHIQEDYEALLSLAERIGPAKPRGLSKAEIDLIPSFRYSSLTAKETNTKCVICMGEYNNREKLRRLPCTHDFHSKCIDKWLRSNKTCPICRDEVNPSE